MPTVLARLLAGVLVLVFGLAITAIPSAAADKQSVTIDARQVTYTDFTTKKKVYAFMIRMNGAPDSPAPTGTVSILRDNATAPYRQLPLGTVYRTQDNGWTVETSFVEMPVEDGHVYSGFYSGDTNYEGIESNIEGSKWIDVALSGPTTTSYAAGASQIISFDLVPSAFASELTGYVAVTQDNQRITNPPILVFGSKSATVRTASFEHSFSPGTHNLTAAFIGDGPFKGSQEINFTIQVAGPTTTTAPTTTVAPTTTSTTTSTTAAPTTTTTAAPATTTTTAAPAAVVNTQASVDNGYRLAASDGGVFDFNSTPLGSMGGKALNAPIVASVSTPDRNGYWLIGADGGVFNFGTAKFFGSTGDKKLNAPIIAAASTKTGNGYWLIGADGGVFSFGDASFHGSTGGQKLNAPVITATATPTGNGYWLLASDGGVFSFGDASFHGSTGAQKLNKPVVGIAPTPTGDGYWLVAADGGVFTFGKASFYGSTGAEKLNQPIVGMRSTTNGQGYWFVARDGGVFNFGNANFYGSTGALKLNGQIVGFA